MATKVTTREFNILVKEIGLNAALRKLGFLDKEMKSASKSTGELDRNMKGAAGATNNTTKAFAKQAQGLGGLVHVYATVAANVFALSSAYLVLRQNSDLKIMEMAARDLSVATGINFSSVAKSMKNITGAAIDMKTAMQAANIGLSGGATQKQLEGITSIATKAANALGRSVPEAVTRMIQAVTKAEPELVDEYGIILRVDEATTKYARSIGKAKTELSTFERQQAIINQLLEQGADKFGEALPRTNPYSQLGASFLELSQSALKFINLPLTPVVKFLSENIEFLALAAGLLAINIGKKALPVFQDFASNVVTSSKEMQLALASSVAEQKADLAEFRADQLMTAKSTKGFAKDIARNVKAGKIPASLRTALGRAVRDGLDPKGIMDAFKVTFSGSLKDLRKEITNALDMDPEALQINTKKYGTLSRETALLIETGWNRSRMAQQDYVDGFTAAINRTKGFGLTTQYTLKSAKLQWTILKAEMLDSFSIGANAKGFTDLKTQISEVFNILRVKGGGAGNLIKSVLGGASTAVGGLLTGAGKLVSKLIPLGFTLSIVWEAVSGIAKATGLWNEQAEKVITKIEELDDNLKLTNESILRINRLGFDSLTKQISRVNTELNLTRNIINDVESLLQDSKSVGTGFFNNIADSLGLLIGDDTDERKFMKAIEARRIQMEKLLGKPFDIDLKIQGGKEITTLFGLPGKYGELRITLSELLKDRDKFLDLRDAKPEAWASFIDQVVAGMKEASVEMEEFSSKVNKANGSMENLSKLFADEANKFRKTTPYSQLITDLQNINDLAQSQQAKGKVISLFTDMDVPLKAVVDRFLTIQSSVEGSIPTFEDYTRAISKALNTYKEQADNVIFTVEQLKLEEENLANAKYLASQGNVSAIREEFRLNRSVFDLKRQQLEAELELLELKYEANYSNNETTRDAIVMQDLILFKAEQINKLEQKKNRETNSSLENLQAITKEYDHILARLKLITKTSETSTKIYERLFQDANYSILDRRVFVEEYINSYRQNIINKLTQLTKENEGIQKQLSEARGLGRENDINKFNANLLDNSAQIAMLQFNLEDLDKGYTKAEKSLIVFNSELEKTKGLYDNVIGSYSAMANINDKLLGLESSTGDNKIIYQRNKYKNEELATDREIEYLNNAIYQRQVLLSENHLKITERIKEENALLKDQSKLSELDVQQKLKALEVDKKHFELLLQYGNLFSASEGNMLFNQEVIDSIGSALYYFQKNFEASMQSAGKTVLRLYTEPLEAIGNTITSGIKGMTDGTTKLADVLENMRTAIWENFVDIILKGVWDQFTNSAYKVLTQTFGITATIEEKNTAAVSAATWQMNALEVALYANTRALLSGSSTNSGVSNLGNIVSGLIGTSAGNSVNTINLGSGAAGDFVVNVPMGEKGGVFNTPTIISEYNQPEAAVPLPDGKSIPVTLTGGKGDVNVYVSVDANGNTNTNAGGVNSRNAAQLGRVVSAAVRREIMEQQRPGGLLA